MTLDGAIAVNLHSKNQLTQLIFAQKSLEIRNRMMRLDPRRAPRTFFVISDAMQLMIASLYRQNVTALWGN